MDLVQAVVAFLVAFGFQWYFRSLARWGKALIRATLIYDAECAMPVERAVAHAAGVPAAARSRSSRVAPPVRHALSAGSGEEACLTRDAARAADDGCRLSGADAVPELFRRIHGWGWVAGVFALPCVRPVARARATRWVAQNRMRISCARSDRRAWSDLAAPFDTHRDVVRPEVDRPQRAHERGLLPSWSSTRRDRRLPWRG